MKTKLQNLIKKGFFGAMMTCTVGGLELSESTILVAGGAVGTGIVAAKAIHSFGNAANTGNAKVNSAVNNPSAK